MAGQWYSYGMRATIDQAGRLVVPKPLRDELGFGAGAELELAAVDGHLEVSVPSRVGVEQGPHGVRFVSAEARDVPDRLTAAQVRELIDRGRR
jgi:AbrB family looped-hinge helix DNA binding protein